VCCLRRLLALRLPLRLSAGRPQSVEQEVRIGEVLHCAAETGGQGAKAPSIAKKSSSSSLGEPLTVSRRKTTRSFRSFPAERFSWDNARCCAVSRRVPSSSGLRRTPGRAQIMNSRGCPNRRASSTVGHWAARLSKVFSERFGLEGSRHKSDEGQFDLLCTIFL